MKKFKPYLILIVVGVLVGLAYISKGASSKQRQENLQTEKGKIVYLGDYKNSPALFFPKMDQNLGELILPNGTIYESFNFQELENPKKILIKSGEDILSINDFIIDDTGNYTYISANYKGEENGTQYPGLLNKILKVGINDQSIEELWSNNVGSDKYPGAKGIASLVQVVDDKYVVLQIAKCYACSESLTGTLVLNVLSKNEAYYGLVGDVKIDGESGTISYRDLTMQEEFCDPEPGCESGKRQAMKPSGEAYTKNLP